MTLVCWDALGGRPAQVQLVSPGTLLIGGGRSNIGHMTVWLLLIGSTFNKKVKISNSETIRVSIGYDFWYAWMCQPCEQVHDNELKQLREEIERKDHDLKELRQVWCFVLACSIVMEYPPWN